MKTQKRIDICEKYSRIIINVETCN